MKTVIEKITRERAMEYLMLNRNNRNINKDIVSFYASQMSKGEWKLTHQGIAISEDGTRLIDGQHRLMAIVKADVPVAIMVSYGVADDIFSVVDTGKVRNAGDVMSIANINNSSAMAASVKKSMKLRRGNSLGSSSKMLKISNTNILNEYNNNSKLYDEANIVGRKCYTKTRLLTHTDISAYIIHLIKDKLHDKTKVYSFFNELFTIEKTTNNSINILRDKIINSSLSNMRMKPSAKQSYIAATWNAYIIGKELKIIRVPNGSIIFFK